MPLTGKLWEDIPIYSPPFYLSFHFSRQLLKNIFHPKGPFLVFRKTQRSNMVSWISHEWQSLAAKRIFLTQGDQSASLKAMHCSCGKHCLQGYMIWCCILYIMLCCYMVQAVDLTLRSRGEYFKQRLKLDSNPDSDRKPIGWFQLIAISQLSPSEKYITMEVKRSRYTVKMLWICILLRSLILPCFLLIYVTPTSQKPPVLKLSYQAGVPSDFLELENK